VDTPLGSILRTVPILISLITVLVGLAFGSFLNVCISRLPQHESVVRPRSRCPHCQRPIPVLENIPILSWFLLRARCRGCGQPISWRYPVIEAATALLFLLCQLTFGITINGIGAMVFCFLLLGLAATDAETLTLPNALTYPGIALGIVFTGLMPRAMFSFRVADVASSIFSGIGFALLILAIRWLYLKFRHVEGLGIGDAKLMAMIAVWMGPIWTGPKLTAEVFFLGVFAAAIYGILLLITGQSRGLKTQLPLGSFLCGAALIVLFQGQIILKWYSSFFR
jgi:leader peptidase (prepilin peptidase) / N-methyltransferase